MTTKFKITVVHKGAVNSHYVGRPTPLGNPFWMQVEYMRDQVCNQYEEWFAQQVANGEPNLMNQLNQLWELGQHQGYLKLACHCAPKRCHANTIAAYFKYLMDSDAN